MQTGAPDILAAIKLARPKWLGLAVDGTPIAPGTPQLYVEKTHYWDAFELRRVPVTSVSLVEFLDAEEATKRFGSGHESGAVIVRLKR